MKPFRLFLIALVASALCSPALPLTPLGNPDQAYAASASTTAKKANIVKLKARTLTAGKTLTLKLPRSAKKARWTSSNKKVATVSAKGTVKAMKAGRCTLKAKVGRKVYTCALTVKKAPKKAATIASGTLRSTAFSLVSSAENSTTNYRSTYGYIEDIGDGRGYTCGIIGFTSATGDLLDVVETYVALKPKGNGLKRFLPALRAVNGTASHRGLGAPFVSAWTKAAKDPNMIEAQDRILKEQYLDPALKAARADGLGPLGQFIYYDALVVHGPGPDSTSFHGMRAKAMKKAKTPARGGSEGAYLKAFLAVRSAVMLQEEAHSDLSRIKAQRSFIDAKNFSLSRPLTWTMYGDRFSLK
ncbi:chitosanase [Adlercreutzia equolifaciens]|uniref:chitosanase n=1 Tax=Adlercreutzia equolifaciens TaxID=446660 RepID=UPI0023B1FED6|nr:chitosanase [Adlercreutzia equolifaciens]MDE8703020.1 chitosanase [Adlercreutzia equolifaciens]